MKPKLWCMFLAVVLCLAFSVTAYAADEIIIRVDGRIITSDVAPQVVNNRTMVPLRVVGEAMSAKVLYDAGNITVTSLDGNKVDITLGEKTMTVTFTNGEIEIIELDVEPLIVNQRTLLPIRAIAEALNAKVDYIPGEQKYVDIDIPAIKIAGQEAHIMTSHTYMIMGGAINAFYGDNVVANIYECLQAGIVKEVSEPTKYGRLLNLDYDNFYYLSAELGFYSELPQVGADGELSLGLANYVLYIRGSGYPDDITPDNPALVGTDIGKYALYDVQNDKWYELSEDAFLRYMDFPYNEKMTDEIFNNIV